MPQIKITRTLYIGLGGTGAKSILRTKKCFIDAYGEVPPMVAFLAIDTDTAIQDLTFKSRTGKDVKFDKPEICFCGINGSAVEIVNQFPAQFQWLPNRNRRYLNNLMGTGAGQVRSNGRFLTRYNSDVLQNCVARKVAQIARPIPLDCKFICDTNQFNVEYPTKVNIVGSVAGGTGSGTFIDMLILTSQALQTTGLNYVITPWMVLPDVFRLMASGVASANVYQNAYGAIKELDYLFHLPNNNNNPLDFGFAQIKYLDEKISYAYLINNRNTAGVTFQNIDELADSLGRCLFLPTNEIGRGSASIEDNIRNFKQTGVYSILNKGGHYVSVGSAEVVYDNQAIGRVIARGIVAKICNELCYSSSTDILNVVNAWTRSEKVAIQEHDADLLIDSILRRNSPVNVLIDKESDANIVNAFIQAGATAENVKEEATTKANEKLTIVKSELLKKIQQLLNSQNGVGETIAFLESLLYNVDMCKKEMHKEALDLQQILQYPINWDAEISALRVSIGLGIKRFDRDLAEALQVKIADHIAQHRDLIRHNLAIQFFTDFEVYTKELLNKIKVFKTNLRNVETKQINDISAIQQLAQSTSHFEIYLHTDEVLNFTLPNISDVSALLRSELPIYDLIAKTPLELDDFFFNFAGKQQSVVDAVNVSIEQKMSSMPEEKLKAIFARVRDMSTPLWNTSTHGKTIQRQPLTSLFLIGVNDIPSSIISKKYPNEFTTDQSPTFVTTHQTDRISIFQLQCLTPAFTVDNMQSYQKEAELKSKNEQFPVYYLDARWHQRMIDEQFELQPKQPQDTVLPNWVNAIVFGYVKFDESKNTYYIKSMKQGDRLKGGFLALGKRRDQAFEQFHLKNLDKEIEERISQRRLEEGNPAVNSILKIVQENLSTYVSDYAQLSATEQNRIDADDQAYQMVRNQLEREITYLNDLVF